MRTAWLSLLVLAACGPAADPLPEPTPTEIGATLGAPVTLRLGPEGGTLTSEDGRVELRFPAGALTTPTEVGIQPVENTAHGGVGIGYDFSPDGATFDAPVEVVLHYTDADLVGTVPAALNWAFQDTEQLWQVIASTVDEDARTVTATTTHFTRFSALTELRIEPDTTEVEVENAIAIDVMYCYELGTRVGRETVFAFHCRPASSAFLNTRLGVWKVNGIPGGNATVGRVGGTFLERASYEAPAEVPMPDTVEVSIDTYALSGHSAGDLSARVHILPRGHRYRGDVTFENPAANVDGVAHLVWEPTNEDADVLNFDATGTVDAHFAYPDCDPVDITLPITGGEMVVYTSENAGFPDQHQFTVTAMADTTLHCGTPREAVPMTLPLAVLGGLCDGPPFATFTDITMLTGNEPCASGGLTRMEWSFRADSR